MILVSFSVGNLQLSAKRMYLSLKLNIAHRLSPKSMYRSLEVNNDHIYRLCTRNIGHNYRLALCLNIHLMTCISYEGTLHVIHCCTKKYLKELRYFYGWCKVYKNGETAASKENNSAILPYQWIYLICRNCSSCFLISPSRKMKFKKCT